MKYILNKGRYALAFEIVKDNRRVKIEFDKRRIYMDTGNVATTGITAVEDEDYKKLCEFKRFKELFETGDFELTDITKVETAETKVKELEKANKELEEKLKKAEALTPEDVKQQLDAKDDEIKSLKGELEKLSKKGKGSSKKNEDKGTDEGAEKGTYEGTDVTEGF